MLRLRGLCKLTWIELKVFLREPLGAIGTIGIPVFVYLGVGRAVGRRLSPDALANSSFMRSGLPVLASIIIAFSAVLSLIRLSRSIGKAASLNDFEPHLCVHRQFLRPM